jgi:hypothetical protein
MEAEKAPIILTNSNSIRPSFHYRLYLYIYVFNTVRAVDRAIHPIQNIGAPNKYLYWGPQILTTALNTVLRSIFLFKNVQLFFFFLHFFFLSQIYIYTVDSRFSRLRGTREIFLLSQIFLIDNII